MIKDRHIKILTLLTLSFTILWLIFFIVNTGYCGGDSFEIGGWKWQFVKGEFLAIIFHLSAVIIILLFEYRNFMAHYLITIVYFIVAIKSFMNDFGIILFGATIKYGSFLTPMHKILNILIFLGDDAHIVPLSFFIIICI